MNTNEALQAFQLPNRQGESFWVLGDHYSFKLPSGQTAGAMAVVELTAFPGNGPPPHIHHREDESFYVLEGTFSVLLANQTLQAGTGAFVHIPRGTLHTYRNVGTSPARVLVILSPGGFENLWREIGQPAEQGSAPPPPPPGVIDKLLALAPQFGLEIPPPDNAKP
jgi:quercetin dioxygenase-like cupin family protein